MFKIIITRMLRRIRTPIKIVHLRVILKKKEYLDGGFYWYLSIAACDRFIIFT